MIMKKHGRNAKLGIVLFFIFLLAVGLPRMAFSGSSKFTIEQVLGYPFPSSLVSARSGERLAWVFDIQGIRNIWVAEGPDFQAHQLTRFDRDDGRPLEIWGFTGDDRAVVFSRDCSFNPDHDPKGSGDTTLYMVDQDSGKIEEIAKTGSAAVSPVSAQIAYVKGGGLNLVSPGEKPARKVSSRGKLSLPRWSPNGKNLVMESRRGKFPYRYSYIMIYDLEGESVRYIEASVYEDQNPCWSPDGKKIAFLRRLTHGQQSLINAREFPTPDPWEVRVADAVSGETSVVWKSGDSDTFSGVELAWLDNEYLVFTSEADGWRHLYAVLTEGGKARQLTEGKFEVERFLAVPALRRVFLTCNANDIDRRHIWIVGIEGKMTAVTGGESIEWNPVLTGDKKFMAFFGSSATQPAQVYVRDLAGGKAKKLAGETLGADFPRNLVVPRQVTFRAADGLKIHGQLFVPLKHIKEKRLAIMYFHGGPIRQMLLGFHYSSYYHRCYAMNQYLVGQGYVVLSLNYRLGIGYGRAFRDVPNGGPRGGAEYQDLLAGAKFLRSLDYVDPDRIGLWGGSYGGLMTALGLARNSDLFACGVDLHGVHDWNQWQAWSEAREDDHDRLAWKSSPLADIENWRSPVLLVHGDEDRNVPFPETLWLAERLAKQGVLYELLVFPDDVHSFLLHKNWVRAFKAAASFFERQLKNSR